jgi:TPR repeat protein
MTLSLLSVKANSATTSEVEKFNRATEFANAAVRSKDYDRAFPYLDEAAKLGNKISQFTLALLYMEGLGVEQDFTKAYFWLNVASEVNEKSWRKVRDEIKSSLSKEQLALLAPLVAEYIAKYGEEAQEVSCYKRAATGTNRKLMQCTKFRTPGR